MQVNKCVQFNSINNVMVKNYRLLFPRSNEVPTHVGVTPFEGHPSSQIYNEMH